MKRHGWRGFEVLSCLVILGAVAFAADPADPADAQNPAGRAGPADAAPREDALSFPGDVAELMQDRQYAEAAARIDELLAQEELPAGEAREQLLYLKGRALHLAQRYDEAVTVFEQLEAGSPDGPWAQRARFGRAVALARKGDFQSAELIYRQEAAALLSLDRKQEIADVYLEFADAYFEPADEQRQPDFAKALEFYGKALEVGPEPQRRAEVELLVARCHQALGNLDEAARRYAQFSKDHAGGPLELEARYRLGETQLAMNQHGEARRTWQDLLAAWPQDKSERIAEAAFNLSLTYHLPDPQNDDDLTLGVAALEAFIERYPDHKLASLAHLRIAASYVARGRHADAVTSLERFLGDERYAAADEVPLARNLLGLSYQLQKKFTQALEAWRDYLAKHPAHQAWSDVQREIVHTEFLMGQEAAANEQFEEAARLWDAFLARYPLDPRNPQILFELGRMLQEQEKVEEAIAQWRRLVSKFPGTDESSRGQLMIAVALEEELGKLDEAVKEYAKVTWGASAGEAQSRLARLRSKALSIATERVFRTNETPRIRVVTRNIETLTVKAYAVDLETYFRKMHLAGGVEALDIALIDPDRTFEFAIPDYAELKQFENEIEVPLPAGEGGVLAVTVSSKTLEATTLVVQSDLDIVVKSSRDEVFVFAENMRTQQPMAGARLLISNGQQVFAEEKTGDDGVFRKALDELKSAGDVRVFAVAGGSVASNVVGLQGIAAAVGLADRGYIYTDRPAYRAGQMVHVRGIVRAARDDAFVVEPGRQYELEVFDSRNRLIRRDKVALGEFGSFHLHFVLPSASVAGDYRVAIHDEEGHNYQGGFAVHEYRLDPVRLTVQADRKVFYRGETIEGRIVARFFYGAPLAGQQIRYQLADGRVYTGMTNEAGELAFSLPTREYRESQVLALVATLAERNLQSSTNFYLAVQGYSIELETVRPVYVAGETFELAVTTRDAEGKPIAEKLALQVLERTNVRGKAGEREIERHEVTTAADGKARVTLRLEQGATYVLRAAGVDRFKNPISGEHQVQVSDDSDSVRLRILADRHTFKLGDTARVQLHWREEPALALVTFQGARVLDYRLVRLAKGANELEVPMVEKLAPNFELSVAVMTDAHPPRDPDAAAAFSRFHTASSPFAIQRDLRVVVEYRQAEGAETVRPGDEIEVAIATTDPQGKPVAAELSLGLVDASLLEVFGSKVPAIDEFFRGQERQPALVTTSSVVFAYRPGTEPIDPNLLAERDRLEVEAEERERLAAGINIGISIADGSVRMDVPQDPTFVNGWASVEQPFGEAGAVAEAMDVDGKAAGANYEPLLAAQQAGQQAGQPPLGVHFGSRLLLDGQQLDRSKEWSVQMRAGDILSLRKEGRLNAVVLYKDGTQGNLDLRKATSVEKAGELAETLARSGAVLISGAAPDETAYWNPAIVTGADGKATVRLILPERTTAWKVQARGISAETLAGETQVELVARKELFGELKLPLAFTESDEAEVLVSVHNDAVDAGAIEVTLKTTIGDKSTEQTRKLEAAKGIRELSFKTRLEAGEARADQPPGQPPVAMFELRLSAGEHQDVARAAVPLLPYGMNVYASASGSAESDTTAWVEPPAGMEPSAPWLEVAVGPTVERSLLDVVLAPDDFCRSLEVATPLDTAASDLMASIAVAKLLEGTRQAGGPEAMALNERIRSSLSLLVASQNDDGGWSWTGQGGSNRYTSARAVWALSLARQSGYAVSEEAFERAIAWLSGQAAAAAETDYETRAILLQALAAAGRGDFTLANRLHRNRPSLSNAGLAYLALALVEMDRKPMAADLLGILAKRTIDSGAPKRREATASLPWSDAASEMRAVYLLALEQVNAQDPRAEELVDWLLAHRSGNRWAPDKATGPATLALADWYGTRRFQSQRYQLKVLVNGFEAGTLDIKPDGMTQRLAVDAGLLKEGKQRIQFQLTGRGRFTYQCTLGGFVAADKLKSTTGDWQVRRTYEPAERELEGEVIPRGFGIVQGSYSPFRNPLTQLPVGERGHVSLDVWRHNVPANTPEEHLEYLVVTEPLPAGAAVVESSVKGGFERFEIAPGAITFYVGSRQYVETIQFEVHGYLAGSYRAAPTVVRNVYRGDQFAVAEAKSLAILPLGSKSGDTYKLTPQELYELGKRHYARGRLEPAGMYLTELLRSWQLQGDAYRDSVTMLLDVHLENGPDSDIVRYFELIKEKWPDVELTFDKIVKVGAAYHELGEYERSYLVFRATVESSFEAESGVAGFLESQGELLRSVEFMSELLWQYPPEPYIAAAQYALAQRVYAYAPQAAADPKLRESKVTRVHLVAQALGMLNRFLTLHPADPAADQAAFSLANALLELEAYREAIARCGQYAKRYAQSDFLDSYWYIIGYSHFALGEHEQALEMCRKVAEAKRTNPQTGQEQESPNKWRAVYILGQVYHSLGQAAEAIREYTRVEDRFADARQAIAYFMRKEIRLPEVTTIRPGVAAEVTLDFRNISRCDSRVYKIDLMKFSLLKRNLAGITAINLAGIRPYHEAIIELGDGLDYRDRTHKLMLPLKDEGAYLVVCRGDDLHASGLVLVTPLSVEVQEDPAAGQVRATVKNVESDGYISDVHVKAIGARNNEFVAGQTDLRGVFVAEGLKGTATVIAQAGEDRYAFFRGATELGPPEAPTQGEPADQRMDAEGKPAAPNLLEGLQESNRMIQQQQSQSLDSLYEQDTKGVQAQEAF